MRRVLCHPGVLDGRVWLVLGNLRGSGSMGTMPSWLGQSDGISAEPRVWLAVYERLHMQPGKPDPIGCDLVPGSSQTWRRTSLTIDSLPGYAGLWLLDNQRTGYSVERR